MTDKEDDILYEKEKDKYYPKNIAYKLKNADGVENYLKKEKKKREKAERKENYDYRFSKYRYWTYWIMFTIGLFGGFYSFYDAFINPKSNEEELNKVRQEILENKELIEEVHILISKKEILDSLPPTNSE